MKPIIIVLAFCLFASPISLARRACLASQNDKDIDSIIAYHLNVNRTTAIPLKCNDIFHFDEIMKFDLTKFKNRILSDLSITKPITQEWISDSRTQIQIWHHNSKIDTICLCQLSSILIDSKSYEVGSDIFYLLDSLFDDAMDKKEMKKDMRKKQ